MEIRDRDQLVEDLAERAVDAADMKSLIQTYYENNIEWLRYLSNNELVDYAINQGSMDMEELQEDYGVEDGDCS